MAEHSRYQQGVIRNYYKNQDAILLQRLQGLITELYLAEGKARKRHWTNATKAMEKLEIPPSRIGHIVDSDDPAILASLVEELLNKQ